MARGLIHIHCVTKKFLQSFAWTKYQKGNIRHHKGGTKGWREGATHKEMQHLTGQSVKS